MQNNCLKNSFLHREIDKSLKIYVESLCKTRFFFMCYSSKMYFLTPITISIPKSFCQGRKAKQNEFCDWHPFPHCVILMLILMIILVVIWKMSLIMTLIMFLMIILWMIQMILMITECNNDFHDYDSNDVDSIYVWFHSVN